MSRADRVRAGVAALFLLAQMAGVVRARFVRESWFSWAPHDRQAEYRIEVTLGGRPLSTAEIHERYRMEPAGWNPHGAADLIDLLARAERRAEGPPAAVLLRYRENGRDWQDWRWPGDAEGDSESKE